MPLAIELFSRVGTEGTTPLEETATNACGDQGARGWSGPFKRVVLEH